LDGQSKKLHLYETTIIMMFFFYLASEHIFI
jgi:hypothetical protein